MEKQFGVKISESYLEKDGIEINIPIVKIPKYPKREARINSMIKNKIKDFIIQETEYDQAKAISVSYEIKLNKRGLLSILFDICSYLAGNKKIFTAEKSINLNIKKAEVMDLKDLFPENIYYNYILNKIMEDMIINNQTPFIQELSDIQNTNHYYLTKDSLVIFIPLYKDTPYAHCYCTPEFVIPLKDIKDHMGSGSPALKLIRPSR